MRDESDNEKELLLHQSAAILAFLNEQGLEKAASKLQKQLVKEFGRSEMPEIPNGKWIWSSNEVDIEGDYESETEESESSSEEEESSSEEEESSEEDDDDDGDDEDDEESEEVDEEEAFNGETQRKSVSFDENVQEQVLSPRKPYKKELYYDRTELQRFKIERNEEKLKEAMAEASATLGVALVPGF